MSISPARSDRGGELVTERVQRMLDLVEIDFGATNSFISGVLATATTVRGWAITICLALAGLGVQQSSWEFGVLALVVAILFGMIDAYHLELYRQAMAHARSLDRLYAEYYGALSRAELVPISGSDLEIELDSHQFGLYRKLSGFEFRRLLKGFSGLFAFVYLALVALSAVLIVVYAWD